MGFYYLKVFGVSLILTEIFELAVLKCMGEMSQKNIKLMLLVNLLTNPAAVYMSNWMPELWIEVFVVCVEAGIYYSFSKAENWEITHPVILAAAANTVSYAIGIILQTGR